MEIINNGTYDNDPSAEAIRASFEKSKNNFAEITANRVYDIGCDLLSRAIPINDTDDLYAHDSRILIVSYSTSKLYALIAYQADKSTKTEFQNTQQVRLIVYDLHTRAIVSSLEVAAPGETYGTVTLASTPVAMPAMHKISSSTVRVYFSNGQTIYYRDLALATLAFGDAAIMQVQIRNAANDGWDAAADATTALLDTHCTRMTGGGLPTNGANPVMPLVRGIDNIQIVGSNYYASMEAYFPNYGDYGVSFLMESADLTAWRLYAPVDLDSSTYINCNSAETSYIYLDSKWHAISRYGNYLYASSEDGGLTWSAQVASGLINPNGGSKCSADYVNIRKGVATYYPIAFFAYNKDAEIYPTGSYGRVTLGVAITEDMATFTDIAIMNNFRTCHYPSIHYFNGLLYMTYTTSERAINTDRDTLMLTVINPWIQLKV